MISTRSCISCCRAGATCSFNAVRAYIRSGLAVSMLIGIAFLMIDCSARSGSEKARASIQSGKCCTKTRNDRGGVCRWVPYSSPFSYTLDILKLILDSHAIVDHILSPPTDAETNCSTKSTDALLGFETAGASSGGEESMTDGLEDHRGAVQGGSITIRGMCCMFACCHNTEPYKLDAMHVHR
jgi:hypothetical protein